MALTVSRSATILIVIEAESSVESLTPRVDESIRAQGDRVRSATRDFGDIADAFNQSGHVDAPQVRVANAQLAVRVGTHGIDVATLAHTRHEDGVVVAAGHMRDLDVEAAHFGHTVRDLLLSDAQLSVVVVY